MTNGEKIKEIFPNFEFIKETEEYRTPQHQFLKVHGVNKMPYMEFDLGWWNAEYKEPTIEYVQKIDKPTMMHEIYMAGVNMAGEYQGCWVRFKEIEKIVDRYVR